MDAASHPPQTRAMRQVRRRTLTEADRAEWAAYARLLRPLDGRELPPEPASPPGPIAAPREAAPAVPRAVRTAALAVGAAPGGLDAASWKRLRSGRLTPERKLDLHGQTAQRAHATLIGFLQAAHADQVRCVEIITGRGEGETGGVLRRELPMWLNAPSLRPLVLAAVHPHPQNPGAVRLLLRRTRIS